MQKYKYPDSILTDLGISDPHRALLEPGACIPTHVRLTDRNVRPMRPQLHLIATESPSFLKQPQGCPL